MRDVLKDAKAAMQVDDAGWPVPAITLIRDLVAEVDRLDDRVNILTKMLRYIAFVATGDESGDPQLGVDRLLAEVERLRAVGDATKERPELALTDCEQALIASRYR